MGHSASEVPRPGEGGADFHSVLAILKESFDPFDKLRGDAGLDHFVLQANMPHFVEGGGVVNQCHDRAERLFLLESVSHGLGDTQNLDLGREEWSVARLVAGDVGILLADEA